MRSGRAALLAGAIMAWAPMTAYAQTQMSDEELQRCVWRCLADSPGAGSSQYNACVERTCVNPAPAKSPKSGWRNTGKKSGGGQMATITAGYSSLSYTCEAGKPALLSVDRLPGPGDKVVATVDGREYRQPFVTRDDVQITALPAGSPLLAALLAGNQAQFRNPVGRSVSTFSLNGSGKAIRKAMRRCGLRP